MRTFTLLGLLFFGASALAQSLQIQSDCTPAEFKVLSGAEIVAQFTKKGSLVAKDCTPFKGPGEGESLIAILVVNTPTGYESYLAVFDRKGFSAQATPNFKSPVLGFDVFPIFTAGKHRLLYVHPASDKTRAVLYFNVQTGPAATRFSRWDYIFERKEFTEGTKIWMIEAGILPKIYEDAGVQRALLGTRSVEI